MLSHSGPNDNPSCAHHTRFMQHTLGSPVRALHSVGFLLSHVDYDILMYDMHLVICIIKPIHSLYL